MNITVQNAYSLCHSSRGLLFCESCSDMVGYQRFRGPVLLHRRENLKYRICRFSFTNAVSAFI